MDDTIELYHRRQFALYEAARRAISFIVVVMFTIVLGIVLILLILF